MNPWNKVPLSDYEAHMSLADVFQLQALHQIMETQLSAYTIQSVMILGIAGGNGLDLLEPKKIPTVIGIDINENYLKVCRERYQNLGTHLVLKQMDLSDPHTVLPKAELILANLFIEYIGIHTFCERIKPTLASYLSCVIQNNAGEDFVSSSPYTRQFDGISTIHQDIREDALTAVLQTIGYHPIVRETVGLPNKKELIRLDFKRL